MIRRLGIFYIKNGEFSDLWLGEWVVETKKEQFGAKVAIKQLRGAPAHNHELREETIKKLNKRGLEWIKLNHDNILKFHGILYDTGHLPAIVSSYCDNGNVLEYMSETQPGMSGILLIILGIACGLQYLHSMNIIHGDLRAANILIDNNQSPVIADFGLTFVIDPAEFTTNKVAGPARWTAPEILDPPGGQENEPPYSQASDIFAFGMTMVEIFTGKPPYSRTRNDSAVIFKILKGERPEIPDMAAEIQDIQDLLISSWEEHPENRPSASEIRQVFERHVKEPTRKKPMDSSYISGSFWNGIYVLRHILAGFGSGEAS